MSAHVRLSRALVWLCAAAAAMAMAANRTGAEEYVKKKDMQRIMQRLEELAERNRSLESTNAELRKKNEEFSRRIKALEQQVLQPAGPADAEELKTRIRALEKQIEAGPGAPGKEFDNLKEDVADLSEIVQVVEKKSFMDRMQISGELRTRFDWFDFKENAPKGFGRRRSRHHHEEEVHGLASNRFRLNLVTQLTDNLRFQGRLVMFKNWNDDDTPEFPATNLFNYSRTPTDNELKVERAYVDYYFSLLDSLPMAFSFGRLTFSDSLPTDLREDTPRKSAYPGLAYDGEGDGIALTVGLEELVPLPAAALRLVYLRKLADNDAQLYRDNSLGLEDVNFFIAQFETGLPGALRNSLFIANFIYMPDIPSPNLTSRGLVPVRLPDSLGDMWKLTFFFESKRFLGSWVDWFAGISFLESNANGNVTVYRLGPVPAFVGLFNDRGRSDRSAWAYHVGGRITVPWDLLNYPKLGIEFNYGSRYWWGINAGSEDPLHKLDVKGQVWDFYYLQPISEHFTLRLGYTRVDSDYGGFWMFGTPDSVDQDITNTYLLFDAKF